MKVTYIHHSGFLVETGQCYYLFDYESGTLPALDPGKPMVVLASHAHSDHYQPSVFSLLKRMGMTHITAVLSRDIPAGRVPEDISCLFVTHGRRYTLPQGQNLETFLSTDEGVAFLIQDGQALFYHAGDLNDWVWTEESDEYNRQMTGSYHKQIRLLAQSLQDRALTAAFVVLDPRQEKDYDQGLMYFLRHIRCSHIYPMHYWDQPEIIQRFLQEHPQYQNRIMRTQAAQSEEITSEVSQ